MIDTTSLFLHIMAAVGLISGGIVQVLAGARVRTATTGHQLASWAGFARGAGLLTIASAVVSLLTGGHLAGAVWGDEAGGFANPFITLGLIGLLVLAPIGPMIGGAKLRRLTAAAITVGSGPAPDELLDEARSAGLWGPVYSLVGIGVGLIALMVYKPGWAAGAVLLLVTFAGGWTAGVFASRRVNA